MNVYIRQNFHQSLWDMKLLLVRDFYVSGWLQKQIPSDITKKKRENGKKYQGETFFLWKAACISIFEHISSTPTCLSVLCQVENGDKVKGHAAVPTPLPPLAQAPAARLSRVLGQATRIDHLSAGWAFTQAPWPKPLWSLRSSLNRAQFSLYARFGDG